MWLREPLNGAGGAVFGSPEFEFVVVAVEQLSQVEGVLGVILGAAGDEGFAEFLEGDGVDGIQSDPFISFEEGDQVAGGLFQAQGHAGVGMLLAQLEQPLPERFGRGVDGGQLVLVGVSVDEAQVGFFIGAIQADDQVVRRR